MIVAFCGAIGAGKDACADYLVRAHGFVKVRFSDAIVTEVATLYRATLTAYVEATFSRGLHEQLGTEALIQRVLVEQRTPVTRALLQDHGIVRRRDDPGYWTRQVEARLRSLEPPHATVTGVRYPDEIAMLRARGARILKVLRPGHTSTPADGHEVENGLRDYADYDSVLMNEGSLADLWARVEAWWRQHGVG